MGKEIKHKIWNASDLYMFSSEQEDAMKGFSASSQQRCPADPESQTLGDPAAHPSSLSADQHGSISRGRAINILTGC